jgi:hypothetical protein
VAFQFISYFVSNPYPSDIRVLFIDVKAFSKSASRFPTATAARRLIGVTCMYLYDLYFPRRVLRHYEYENVIKHEHVKLPTRHDIRYVPTIMNAGVLRSICSKRVLQLIVSLKEFIGSIPAFSLAVFDPSGYGKFTKPGRPEFQGRRTRTSD